MLPHRRKMSAGENLQFSFASNVTERDLGHDWHAEHMFRVDGHYSKDGSNLEFEASPRRVSGENEEDNQFQWLDKFEWEGKNKDGTPPLRNAALPASANQSDGEKYPAFNKGNRLHPITNSKIIAKYRQEMMELVKNVPETAYELSLRDLVELPKTMKTAKETPQKEQQLERKTQQKFERVTEEQYLKKTKPQQKVKGQKQFLRNQSMESGILQLKMFFPMSIGRRKSRSAGSKVSPKPVQCDGQLQMERGGHSETWNNLESGKSGSPPRRKNVGCYLFLQSKWANVKRH